MYIRSYIHKTCDTHIGTYIFHIALYDANQTNINLNIYRIRQNSRGGKLLRLEQK